MDTALSKIDRRILGVLLEKSLAQPKYYPMTLNAIAAACNQKSNRNPIMMLDEETIASVLNDLRNRGLVSMELPSPGARVNRFKHKADTYFKWDKTQSALMAELLLRGPQTVGELRTRCSRMAPFANIEAVADVLDILSQSDPPMVTALSREQGRSAIRYTHLLYLEDEQPDSLSSPPLPAGADAQNLQRRLESLHAEVAELHNVTTELHRRLASIEEQLT